MIGLDTNIIIRYLTQDDPEQTKTANQIIENTVNVHNQGFISLVVLVEIVWVLHSRYGQSKAELTIIIEQLLTTKQLQVEQMDVAIKALRNWQKNSGDYSDALIAVLSQENGCNHILTFDKKATSLGMTLAE